MRIPFSCNTSQHLYIFWQGLSDQWLSCHFISSMLCTAGAHLAAFTILSWKELVDGAARSDVTVHRHV